MNKYDEKDWGIEIAHCDDNDLLLRQGECGCGDEVTVRLHTCHFPLIAKHLGLMTQQEFDTATDRSDDRLHLLASLINTHLAPEHPLVRELLSCLAPMVSDTSRAREMLLATINKFH